MTKSSQLSLKQQASQPQQGVAGRHFNAISVALITVAALYMGSAVAQESAPAKPAQASTPAKPTETSAPAKPAEMSAKVQEAFERADKNVDGKLSKEEAASMPAIAEVFDKSDLDKDGFLSRTEFARVAKE